MKATFKKPFKQQVDFFKQKLSIPTAHWDDLQRSEHDHAFVVAGAMKADLLADLRGAVDKAISEGKSLGAFRKEFREIVAKRGWINYTGSESKAGIAWRTRTIYKTNMDTSYMAGRWQQMTDPDVMRLRPYWRYVHNTVENPRADHKRWHNTVLPAGHEWFKAHYPPNGFGCNCGVETLSVKDLERQGLTPSELAAPASPMQEHINDTTGEITQAPKGIQPGWDYATGASAAQNALAARQNRLETFDNALARNNVAALLNAPLFNRFYKGEVKGEYPVAVLNPKTQQALGVESQLVLLSDKDLKAMPEISAVEFQQVQSVLDFGEITENSKNNKQIAFSINGVFYSAVLERASASLPTFFLRLLKS